MNPHTSAKYKRFKAHFNEDFDLELFKNLKSQSFVVIVTDRFEESDEWHPFDTLFEANEMFEEIKSQM